MTDEKANVIEAMDNEIDAIRKSMWTEIQALGDEYQDERKHLEKLDFIIEYRDKMYKLADARNIIMKDMD